MHAPLFDARMQIRELDVLTVERLVTHCSHKKGLNDPNKHSHGVGMHWQHATWQCQSSHAVNVKENHGKTVHVTSVIRYSVYVLVTTKYYESCAENFHHTLY